MPRWFTSLACLLLFAASFAAQAQVRAWIDRDQVALGETLTLNVETTDAGARAPDWSPPEKDFIVSGNSSSRQVEIVNGRASSTEERRGGKEAVSTCSARWATYR